MPPRYRCPRSLGTDDERDYPGPMPSATRTTALTATLVLSLGGLVACGSGGSAAQDPAGTPSGSPAAGGGETPTATPTPAPTPAPETPALPACSEIWVAGATVPGRYEGCLEGERTVPADGRYCEFGKPLFTYGRDLWAVAGGPINVTEQPLLRDPGYRRALKQCGG